MARQRNNHVSPQANGATVGDKADMNLAMWCGIEGRIAQATWFHNDHVPDFTRATAAETGENHQ